jgi:Leu/Phe-tRNA-protein transferase
MKVAGKTNTGVFPSKAKEDMMFFWKVDSRCRRRRRRRSHEIKKLHKVVR